MDLSKLTEEQKQQLQQLHQQFQQHQQEQQQQQKQQQEQQQIQQQSQTQSYEPSSQQQQSYDPSSQQQQSYDQSYYQYQQYQSQYYQPDYTNPYDPSPIQPPGVSSGPDVPQPNSYYPAEQQPNSSSSALYPVPSGLNPAAAAAVAALSQLTQFAGNMGAAERAMTEIQGTQWSGYGYGYGPPHGHGGDGPMQMPPYMAAGPYGGYHHQGGPYQGHMGGRPPYRGGGKRGGSPFRGGGGGGGRGNYGQRPPRGRGRGGKGRNQRATSSNPEMLPTGELVSEQGDGNASHEGVPARSGKAASSTKRQPQIAWCELCRVDCTSVEILEQHKNGKKHKKNLQRFEELQKAENPVPVTNPAPTPSPALTVDSALLLAPELPTAQESLSQPNPEVETTPQEGENNNTEAPADANNNDSNVVEPELGKGEENEVSGNKRKLEQFDSRNRGMNKKARGGRGGKKGRTFDRQYRATEPSRPKEVIPIICDLCNVKCDTAAVFQTHLGGKKHIAKLKKFQGHQALFGPLGLQALYPPNPNTQPIFIPQIQHHHHQQPAMYAPDGSFNHQGGHPYEQPPHGNINDMPLEFNGQQSNVSGTEIAGPVPEYGVTSSYSENVGVSGADTKVDDGAIKTGETS